MNCNVYVVWDSVAEEAGPPFVAVNDGIARRMYKNMNIPEALKGDYQLVRIGYYNSKDMQLAIDIPYKLTEEGEEPYYVSNFVEDLEVTNE